MIFAVFFYSLLVRFASGENLAKIDLDPTDLLRAYQPRPLPDSHVTGATGKSVFAAMNVHLASQSVETVPCEELDHASLNEIARQLFPLRDKRLNSIYGERKDRRALHFDDMSYKEMLWEIETNMTVADPRTYGIGSVDYNMKRDGKCAELVQWWVHHLTVAAKKIVESRFGFKLPLMPNDEAKTADQNEEYVYQVTCTSCHTNVDIPSPSPAERHTNVGNTTACPKDPTTGLPTVWFEAVSDVGNRKKRCDWDYDPPCQMCEGIGGTIWGDQENEIKYTTCSPVMKPADIPKDNVTSPIWPPQFTVQEPYVILIGQTDEGGQFPGADPCAPHEYKNSSEVLYFDSVAKEMRYTTKSKLSSTSIWHLGIGNMFIKIDNTYCICVGVTENGNRTKKNIGPLHYDFAKDGELIGREKIYVENLDVTVVADHWNKGPHHFWIDVATNQMIRAWQPFNGLEVYKDWNYTAPDPNMLIVDKSCYTGALHKNISCNAPPPGPSPTQ